MPQVNGNSQAVSDSYQAQSEDPKIKVPERSSKLWCHTIGRISCAVRVPLYGITAFFVLTKIAFKLPWSAIQGLLNITIIPITKASINLFKEKPLEQKFEGSDSCSFTGMTRDLIALANATQRMFNSIWLTIVAPPSFYRELSTANDRCEEMIIGNYHVNKQSNSPNPVSDVYKGLIVPNYILQITSLLRPHVDNLSEPDLNTYYLCYDCNG
jgi:hypothetical protein